MHVTRYYRLKFFHHRCHSVFRIRFSGTAFANVRKYAIEKNIFAGNIIGSDRYFKRCRSWQDRPPGLPWPSFIFRDRGDLPPSKLFHTPTPLLGLSCCTWHQKGHGKYNNWKNGLSFSSERKTEKTEENSRVYAKIWSITHLTGSFHETTLTTFLIISHKY